MCNVNKNVRISDGEFVLNLISRLLAPVLKGLKV